MIISLGPSLSLGLLTHRSASRQAGERMPGGILPDATAQHGRAHQPHPRAQYTGPHLQAVCTCSVNSRF